MPSLLPEILHLILQNLHEDAPALKQCALVNRSWLHEAQPLLFSTHPICIHFLDVPHNSEPPERRIREQGPSEFIELVDESPHLRSLIRVVKLHLANIEEDFDKLSPDCQRWSIASLLSPLHDARLRAIETLVLYDRDFGYKKEIILDLPWSETDPGLEMTFSSVTCLDIGASINTPSLMTLQRFLCSSFPQLRHLSLRIWPSIQDSNLDMNSISPPNTLCLQRLDISGGDGQESNGVLMAWFSQTRTVDTLEHLKFLSDWKTLGIAELVTALSKPWSLHIARGNWMTHEHDWISSGTLAELTIDYPYKMAGEIYIRMLVKVCRFFDAPALHTLRWTFDFRRNGQHPHFMHLGARGPTIPRNRFPVLKRMEIHFRCAEAQRVWNCSALKSAFEGHDDLKFIYAVPTADGPMPP